MKTILSLIISGALVVSGYAQTRNVLVGTNNAVVQPTNFWSADASNARTGLGLGSAATNPASAFQPSSLSLSNLASGNASALTNLQASNLVGTINVSNIPVVTLTNISGILAVSKGGTGATNASDARQNLGATTVGNDVFVATNAEAARTAISALAPNGNAASLTNFPALLLRTNGDGSGVTNISGANIVGAVASASNITGTISISNVSNLQSSLDGKLGTNPTLAIANISNLQTTLDGKLGTNPTLQISNIASLQTALDGKLSGSFPIAISNVSGLQTSLDGKLGTNPTLAIANINGLQTNLDSKLSLTGNAVNLTNFPASLLRTTGDASGLTNFPTLNQNTTGTASNVTGVVAVTNGGTGTNSASGARANLGLSWSGLTNTNAETFRTALGLGSLSTLSVVAISNVTGLQTALDGKLASNGNAINLTNFPTSLLRVDGSAAALTNFPASLLRTTGDASGLTNFPTLNQNTTGTASNVTGVVSVANGGTGATNAANARTALGLGTASTNPATAFQPSSTVLSNLANNNGSSLTNITAANIGTVALASNITGTAPLATNVTGVVAVANGGTGATNAAGARTALGVGASDVFVGLTNLGTGTGQGFASSPYILGSTNSTAPNNAVLALDAAGVRSVAGLTLAALTNTDNASFRTAVGLGSAATNPASAFQPSSTVLSNLASNNGASLTNIAATNVVGVLATNGSAAGLTNFPTNLLRVDGSAAALTNFPSLLLRTNGNGAGLTNLTAANITGTVGLAGLASNVTGTIAISNGGSGATTAGGARTNLGLGATDNITFANVTTEQLIYGTNGIISLANQELYDASGQAVLSWTASEFVFETYISFNSDSNKAITRTNLGLGWSGLTNTNASTFRSALELGTTNTLTIAGIVAQNLTITAGGGITLQSALTNAASFRTNIGIPWSGLTNTNAATFQTALFGTNTNPVLVNTNGEVVSPTNFWQVAPASTLVQNFTNISANATNTATNARNLYLYSFSSSHPSGITNTVQLPTNSSAFNGDVVTVVHLGTTSGVTAVRPVGGSTITSISQNDEAVRFIRKNGTWALDENVSFFEPIYFSGTNATANAAASRANLGLGATNDVTFAGITLTEFGEYDVSVENIVGSIVLRQTTNTLVEFGTGASHLFYNAISFNSTNNAAATRTNLGLGATNEVQFARVVAGSDVTTNDIRFAIDADGIEIEHYGNKSLISFVGATNLQNRFRTDIGLGSTNIVTFAGLTNNGDITINQTTATNGLLFIRRTNNEPFLGLANLIASNNTTVSNETLFRVGVQEATNKAAQFGFRSTNTNGNGVAVFSVFGYNALMQIGADASTNAVIFSGGGTNNEVMTLIKNGATEFARPVAFSSTSNAATTRTNLGLGETNNVTFSALTLSSDLTFGSGDNIVLSTTTGTKIGTATNQLLGFYNQTPITQPSSTGLTNGFTGGGGGATVHPQSTFTGGIGTNAYTISDIVAHLKSLGLIAP